MFIKGAALLFQRGGVVEGHNYNSIIKLGQQMGLTSSYISGFVDSHDNFVDNYKAAEIAKTAGQVPADFTGPLEPTDLVPDKENDCAS